MKHNSKKHPADHYEEYIDNGAHKRYQKPVDKDDYHGGYNESGYDEKQYTGRKRDKGGSPSKHSNSNAHSQDPDHNHKNNLKNGRFKK